MATRDKIELSEFVVKSKVKVLLKEEGMRGAEDIWEELGHQVTRAVKIAIQRARANGRKTVKGCDI